MTNDWGVIPDVVVEMTPEEQTALRRARHEQDTSFLESGTDASFLPIDKQLGEAIKILTAGNAPRRTP
jgi:hypothetical protein